jgi:hypothetical protein
MTSPLIMTVFGTFSVIGIFASLIVLPVMPAAYFLFPIVSVLVFLAPAGIPIFRWPLESLLTGIMMTAKISSALPFAQIQVPFSLALMFLSYLLTLIIFFSKSRRETQVI